MHRARLTGLPAGPQLKLSVEACEFSETRPISAQIPAYTESRVASDNLPAMSSAAGTGQVIATLVVGSDGSTAKDGSSRGVTSTLDRARFLERRRHVDAILIGGNTARTEPYRKTPVPVVVISTSMINALADNRQAYWWNASPSEALERARRLFGPTILVEAGASIINELIASGEVDRLELSVTRVSDGEDRINIEEMLSRFTHVEHVTEGETIFYTATRQ
jgi:riboflavin biosynthesis pyrimidine reductase